MPTPPPRNPTKREQKKAKPKDTEIPKQETSKGPQFTPSLSKLRDKVELFYKMMGSFVTPVGRWYSGATGIGEGLKEYSNEAADAWTELASENQEIKRILESLTSASAWGNVIGVHFVIISKINQQTEQAGQVVGAIMNPEDLLRSQGYTEEAISKIMDMARGVVMSDRPPEEAVPQAVTPDMPVTHNSSPSGMPSPAAMGVTPDGEAQSNAHENVFPADTRPVQGGKSSI